MLEAADAGATGATAWWIVDNRARIHVGLRSVLVDARSTVARWAGLDADALAAHRLQDPWPPRLLYHDMHAPEAHLARQMAQWQAFGWFDERLFSTRSAEARAFAAQLDAATRFAPHTLVVLMPESSALRARVPERAGATLQELVAAQAAPSIRLLDLRAALPDTMFHDHVHLNRDGRARLSMLLGEHVAALRAAGR
jgi:hypothetical protein